MIKLCIWMNIPSHLQSAFFKSLERRRDVDLQVRYFQKASAERLAQGWDVEYAWESYEQCVDRNADPATMLESVPDWKNRIHITNRNFHPALVDYFCRNAIRWCHWSERPGIRLAERLQYYMPAFRLAYPFSLLLKRREGRQIRTHALGAFGQGCLARKAFRIMGIPAGKYADLYYTTTALPNVDASSRVVEFAAGRKVFLSVCSMSPRKGIDLLLKAFARCRNPEWCLVLCGMDLSSGVYAAMASRLDIADRVLFLGPHPSSRLAEVYAAADVFVLASRFDGWGAVLNEAASMGLPLVATDMCGAAWHLIEQGGNGVRVRAGSARALAEGLGRYLDHPALVKSDGARSREIFFEQFTPEANAERLLSSLAQWGGYAD